MSTPSDNIQLVGLPDEVALTPLWAKAEDAVSSPFVIHVGARVDASTFDAPALLGCEVAVQFAEAVCYHGVITHTVKECVPSVPDTNLWLTLVPTFYRALNTDRETAFHFVSRLLHEVGIHYYFTHQLDQHTLVLTDAEAPNPLTPLILPYHSATHTGAAMHTWQWGTRPAPAERVTRCDDPPHTADLASPTVKSGVTTGLPDGLRPKVTAFEPAPLGEDASQVATEHNQHWRRAWQAQSHWAVGSGTGLGVTAGRTFTLTGHEHPLANQDYVVSAIYHEGHNPHTPWHDVADDHPGYQHQLVAQPATVGCHPITRYQPASATAPARLPFTLLPERFHLTPPRLPGLQKAVVIGPKGRDIHTDKGGRVQVRFEFEAGSAADDPSVAWLRVRQPGMGMVFTPRLGETVLVQFEGGQTKVPVVIGVLPATLPFTPGHTPGRSGVQSRSLAKAKRESELPGHQLQFDDAPETAGIQLNSNGDIRTEAIGERTLTIGGHMQVTSTTGTISRQANGHLYLTSDEAVHLVNGTSRLSVTPSDIILEADTLHFGQGTGAVPCLGPTKPPLMGEAQPTPPVNTRQYWLKVQYAKLKPAHYPRQAFALLTTGDEDKAKTFSGELSDTGLGQTHLPNAESPHSLALTLSDVIAINQQPTGYPSREVAIPTSAWQTATTTTVPGETLTTGAKVATVQALFPPILLNLRDDAPPGAHPIE